MFYIRADGNADIGMGHVMRCLSIAEAACSMESKPTFILADEGCREMIADRGFQSIVLDTDYKAMEEELPGLAKMLNKEDILLVDSYQVTVQYYQKLRELCRVACLEDMGNPYPVDLLINYNIYGPDLRANYEGINAPAKVLLGVTYMPLRDIYREDIAYEVREKVTDVMITTGGSDPHFAAGALLDAILNDPELSKQDIMYHVVSGPFNRFIKKLKDDYGKASNVTIYEGLNSLKALMKRCDVVITPTGSTIYEVSVLGVPMICFYFAENQRQGAQALARLTDIENAGCFTENKAAVIHNIINGLLHCIDDKAYRQRLYAQEKELIDEKGARRLAEAVLEIDKK